jgi:hypothetical protein
MYHLSDSQIDFISNDIRARGVEIESLQQNLLDHVCCIIELNLEENGDFESFYQKTIRTFYKDALWEIEEETITLLTFKNYYTMKKLMILSGILSAFTMVMGIWFKYMHWPGASFFLPLGIFSGSLVFLPLLFTFKAKEQQGVKDKLVLATGALSAILVSLSFVFKIMNWPHSINMLHISAVIILVLFLPLYLFNGIRNPATKTNTIVTSLLVIMGYTLLLSLVRTPRSEHIYKTVFTQDFVRSEHILDAERRLLKGELKNDSSYKARSLTSQRINTLCEDVKSAIIEQETGHKTILAASERNILLQDRYVETGQEIGNKLREIRGLVNEYNSTVAETANKIPTEASFMQEEHFECNRSAILLNELVQVQMFLLQNERGTLASR